MTGSCCFKWPIADLRSCGEIVIGGLVVYGISADVYDSGMNSQAEQDRRRELQNLEPLEFGQVSIRPVQRVGRRGALEECIFTQASLGQYQFPLKSHDELYQFALYLQTRVGSR